MPMTKTGILDRFEFLDNGGHPLRATAERLGVLVSLPAGEFFYHKGDHCPHFALVGRGSLRVFQPSPEGREITLYYVEAGETCMVNTMCVFLGNGSPATAVVESDVDALLLPAATFRQWLGESNAVREYFFSALGERLAGVMALVEEVAFRRLDQRLADSLLRRLAKLGGDRAEIMTTHEAIAVELGSSREVISRLLKEFQRQGAVDLGRGRIGLRDVRLLQALGSGVGAAAGIGNAPTLRRD
jgi:CRP/FNR family transcriptional regulator